MVRCIIRPEQIRGDVVTLDAAQTRHLIAALRLRPGDEFLAVTGTAQAHVAVVASLHGRQATARLRVAAVLPPPEPWAVTLAAAIPHRPGAFDLIVDQATQLGVAAIIPLVTARTIVRLDPARAAGRQRRWARLAVEAAQQAGQGLVPPVAPVTTWDALLQNAASYDLVFLPTPGAAPGSWASLLRQRRPRRLLVIIGPEGDFTPQELAQAAKAGMHQISLGHNVLRCETAATVAVSLLLYALRDPLA